MRDMTKPVQIMGDFFELNLGIERAGNDKRVITKFEMDSLMDHVLNTLVEHGFECAGGWYLKWNKDVVIE